MAVTVSAIVAGILDRLNATSNEFWQDNMFLAYAKDFLRRHDVREACWHQAKSSTLTTVKDQNEYILPADHWRPDCLFWTIDGTAYELQPGELGDRYSDPTWHVRGGKLWLEPAPTQEQAGRGLNLYYVRVPTEPASTSAALDMPDELAPALEAYLMARALEKSGPENAQRASMFMQQAIAFVRDAIRARDGNRGEVGFTVRARW